MVNKKTTNDNRKGILCGICSAIAIILVIIIIAVIVGSSQKIDDSYFVSDGSKYVFSMDYSTAAEGESTNEENTEETKHMPKKVHQVYNYSGDTITGFKVYYEYNDANAANAALNYIKSEEPDTEATIDGKYIIFVADESEYSGYTASEVKEMIDFYEHPQTEDNEDSAKE